MTTVRLRRWLVATVAFIALASLAAVALLWPTGKAPDLGVQPRTYVDATVTHVHREQCQALEVDALTGCQRATVRLTSGPDAGHSGEFVIRDIDFDKPEVHRGDHVELIDIATNQPPYRYVFFDFQRGTLLWVLLAGFVITVLALGRWQGARALLGLGLSGLMLVWFIVPATLRDRPPVLVALAGTVVIAVVALYLAHGPGMATTVALAGTLVSLAVIVGITVLVVEFAHLTGLSDDQAQVLRVTASAVDLRGLLIAGVVVGALGVLDDVTVTQVSTVMALRRARPDLPPRTLYREALHVGRDHIASTVNTLVLAYAGASLPLLLLLTQRSAPLGRTLSSEVVATEIVRMLIGSIGLVLSVPVTTALAAAVLTVEDSGGHHHHGDHGSAPRPSDQAPQRAMPEWEDFVPLDASDN